MRCLIVEDDATLRVMTSAFLADLAEVVTVCDGREGAGLFARAYEEKNPFDLVLLDIIPEMDGRMAKAREVAPGCEHREQMPGDAAQQRNLFLEGAGNGNI